MQVLENYIQSLEIDRLKTYKDISLCFLKRQNPTNLVALNYDEGLITKGLEVKEISGGGDVNSLKFTNVSLFNIFVPPGVILALKHLKQVRSTTHGFLIKPRETLIITNIICVEEGRWAIDTDMNIGRLSPQYLYPKLRAANLRHRENINQHEVWQDIKRLREQKHVESPTGFVGDVYQHEKATIEDYVKNLPCPENTVGFIALLKGKYLIGIESFNERLFKKNYAGLLSGIAVQSQDTDFYEEIKKKESLTVEQFLREIASINKQPCKAIGDSQDFRFENEHLVGSALVSGDAVYHLEAFAI